MQQKAGAVQGVESGLDQEWQDEAEVDAPPLDPVEAARESNERRLIVKAIEGRLERHFHRPGTNLRDEEMTLPSPGGIAPAEETGCNDGCSQSNAPLPVFLLGCVAILMAVRRRSI